MLRDTFTLHEKKTRSHSGVSKSHRLHNIPYYTTPVNCGLIVNGDDVSSNRTNVLSISKPDFTGKSSAVSFIY